MTMTLVEQIEEMRIRMHEESRGEQHLVNALGLALKRADEKLLGQSAMLPLSTKRDVKAS